MLREPRFSSVSAVASDPAAKLVPDWEQGSAIKGASHKDVCMLDWMAWGKTSRIRIVVSTPRCGRGNLSSNLRCDTFCHPLHFDQWSRDDSEQTLIPSWASWYHKTSVNTQQQNTQNINSQESICTVFE